MNFRVVIGIPIAMLAYSSAIAQGPLAPPDPVALPDPLNDVQTTNPGDLPFFYDFSWRLFIALNWPARVGKDGKPDAASRGVPDYDKTISETNGPRVWTTWKSRFEIFRPKGAPPFPWASYDGENPCGKGFTNGVVTLSAFSPFADFNQAGEFTRFANPLVAQNHSYVRYEVRVNEREFNSIVGNRWYVERNLPDAATDVPFNIGSIEIKAAWRVLKTDEKGIRDRYYVVPNAQVFDGKKCVLQDVALVGLHIVAKTKTSRQWIWSTFEHVDNVPRISSEPTKPQGVPFSFNNGDGPSTLDPATPPPPITPMNFKTDPHPMQVIRKHKISDGVMDTNRKYWDLTGIKDTLWQNYMLVLTQWPTTGNPAGPTNPGEPFPGRNSNLVNTSMETYLQDANANGNFPSCMGCHGRSNAKGRDFVWFVTFDAFRPGVRAPGDLFSTKIYRDPSQDSRILSRDPALQSLIEYFENARQK
jgi:hypothetical protein